MVIDKPVQTLSFDELLTQDFPQDPYIIGGGLLPENCLLFVAGPPKSYKSFLLNTVLYHLTVGTSLFGAYRKPHGHTEMTFPICGPQRVLFLEQEIGFYDTRERLLPLWKSLTPNEQQLMSDNLFIHSRDHSLRLDTKDGGQRIADIIAQVRPTVVCFDPLVEFHGRDENDAQEMLLVMRYLDQIRDYYKFATIMSHHTGKPDPSKFRSGPDQLRGSSVIYGKGDSFLMLTVQNRAGGILRVDMTLRRGAPLLPMKLVLDWGELKAKFHEWVRSKTDDIAGLDESKSLLTN